MQNRHPLEQELCQLLKDETMKKTERAVKLQKILSFFKISNDYYDEQVEKYNEALTTYGFKLFDLNALKRADIDAEGGYTHDAVNTALTHAIYHKDEQSAHTLLNANANPNFSCAPYHQSPLLIASAFNLKSCVTHLLEKKAEINAERTNDKGTALHLAASNGCVDIVNILLANGADHTAMNSYGNTALDLAIKSSKYTLSTVKLLLEKGASIKNPSVMQSFLMSQDQNDEAVKYCYTKLTQYSISLTPNTSTQNKALTFDNIISRIQLKIKESRSNDKGFSSLFRDIDFSAKQIKIAEELINRLNNINTQLTSDKLKAKIALEFETALNAFTTLLGEKNKTGRVGTRALGPDADTGKCIAGTRFHATILALAMEISNSDITQDSRITQNNDISGDGITLFELEPLTPLIKK